jgi:hypothetical protein
MIGTTGPAQKTLRGCAHNASRPGIGDWWLHCGPDGLVDGVIRGGMTRLIGIRIAADERAFRAAEPVAICTG